MTCFSFQMAAPAMPPSEEEDCTLRGCIDHLLANEDRRALKSVTSHLMIWVSFKIHMNSIFRPLIWQFSRISDKSHFRAFASAVIMPTISPYIQAFTLQYIVSPTTWDCFVSSRRSNYICYIYRLLEQAPSVPDILLPLLLRLHTNKFIITTLDNTFESIVISRITALSAASRRRLELAEIGRDFFHAHRRSLLFYAFYLFIAEPHASRRGFLGHSLLIIAFLSLATLSYFEKFILDTH